MKQLVLVVVCSTMIVFAVQASTSREAFEATKQYTQEMLGDKETLGGRVVETLDVSTYTYVQLKQGQKSIWLATNKLEVRKGDYMSFEGGQLMHKFHSKTLNRTFDEIYFVNEVVIKR